jgi:hypothetical protein
VNALHGLLRALPLCTGLLIAGVAGPARADDLCGRPMEAPDALFERLAKTEKLPEIHRDKGYVALYDKARDTTWTFTLAGHPAHPSAVCRHPVQEGDRLRIEMSVSCRAVEAECEKLVDGFEKLNERMLQDLEKQKAK